MSGLTRGGPGRVLESYFSESAEALEMRVSLVPPEDRLLLRVRMGQISGSVPQEIMVTPVTGSD